MKTNDTLSENKQDTAETLSELPMSDAGPEIISAPEETKMPETEVGAEGPKASESDTPIEETKLPEEALTSESSETSEELPSPKETETSEASSSSEALESPEASSSSEELSHTEEPENEEKFFEPRKPYHERYYLLYGEETEKSNLDLKGTKAFLQEIGFDGGELRQARNGELSSEKFKNAGENKNNQLFCSYCGCEISGVDFYRLPDGRTRCTSCSNSIVKSKSEISDICKRVVDNLEAFFGATINVPVSIEVLDERKLKKKIGCSIGERDDKSLLILGVAVNKKKQYSVLLENGAPRISIVATFAHELTHIWQYTHWTKGNGFKKLSRKQDLVIKEGMAKWVEIQYLYLIGETSVAKREEEYTLKRDDEYGIGFRLYEDAYPLSRDAMSCSSTPFTTDRYPIGD